MNPQAPAQASSTETIPAHGFKVSLPNAAPKIFQDAFAIFGEHKAFERFVDNCLLRLQAGQSPRATYQAVVKVNVGSSHRLIIHQLPQFLCISDILEVAGRHLKRAAQQKTLAFSYEQDCFAGGRG
ncbi:MAG: hypothetical protein ACYDA9_05710 [Terriglobia bacterium]